MSTAPPELSPTSYAVLGLLALRPWGTYELARQMERSLDHFWPRARSKLYEEPKKLAALGFARARRETVGRRSRTVYSITAAGRRALANWTETPGAGPVLECEALLKAFFSDQSSKAAAAANVAAIREWAEARNEENTGFARGYLEDGGPFPRRLAQIVLIGRFLTEFTDMVGRWSEWAEGEIDAWPADATPEPDWAFLREVAARGDGLDSI